jgi:hypothetical protein
MCQPPFTPQEDSWYSLISLKCGIGGGGGGDTSSTCCNRMRAASIRLCIINASAWLTALMPSETFFGKGDFC